MKNRGKVPSTCSLGGTVWFTYGSHECGDTLPLLNESNHMWVLRVETVKRKRQKSSLEESEENNA